MKTEIRFYIIREVSNNYNKEDKDLATIKDIANRLGVSVSTVSKGLNGASDISDELRQMVLDTAVEMGYATKRSKKVENRKLAIFIENMEWTIFAGKNAFHLLQSCEKYAIINAYNYLQKLHTERS